MLWKKFMDSNFVMKQKKKRGLGQEEFDDASFIYFLILVYIFYLPFIALSALFNEIRCAI